MRVSPEQLRKALADMFRDPESRGLILQYLIPRLKIQGATVTKDRIAKFDADSGSPINTDTPIFERQGPVEEGSPWRVCIGTFETDAKPVARLHLRVNSTTDPVILVDSTDQNHGLSFKLQHPNAVVGFALSGGGGQWLGTSIRDDAIVFGQANKNLLFGLGGTEYARIKGGGNFGIGVTDPGEKLEVGGNIKSYGLNKVIFLNATEHNAGTSGRTIQDAINNLPANGGVIMLEPGSYNIGSNGITISKNGVKLRGYGGIPHDTNTYQFGQSGGQPLTKLVWTPTSPGGTVLNLKSPASSGKFITDLEVSDLAIDCNDMAYVGLQLDAVVHSRFINIHVWKPYTTGILLTTTQSTAEIDTAWNLFLNCSVYEAPVGVQLTAVSTFTAANCSHNTFIGLSIEYEGAAGIKLTQCDNNAFYDVWIFQVSGEGVGVLVDNPDLAESNYFFHLQADGGFKIAQASSSARPDSKHIIFGYDKANSQVDPTSPSGTSVRDYVYWTDSQGDTDLKWENLSSALSASNFPATRKSEFGFVFDGTNMWLIFNDGSNKWKWQGTQVT